MPFSNKSSHLSSDEHENHIKKMWCEVCDKSICDIP